MQTETNEAFRSDAFVSQATFDAAQAAAAEATQAAQNRKAAAKRIAERHNASVKAANIVLQPTQQPTAKPNRKQRRAAASANPAKPQPAKPTTAEREAAQRDRADGRRLERGAAAAAVAAFYRGASLPFKAASDRFADYNPSNAKAATPRQAGLLLCLITYGAGNMRRDGSFVRGGFRIPARLINPNAPADMLVSAQPESGCLGNLAGRACDYVSGPRSGPEQRAALYKLRVPAALAEIQAAFGDAAAADAKARLAAFPAAKRA
jgi:hypothetical protein